MSKRSQQGFTLVELTIAVAFLSVLLIAILTISLMAGKLYIKGDTNKTVNQAARDFSDVVRRDFLASGVESIVIPDPVNAGPIANPLLSGRACLGNVTYLWNDAALLNDTNSSSDQVRITYQSSGDPIRFVRIFRPKQQYCDKDAATGRYPHVIASGESTVELFGGTGREYALHSLTMAPLIVAGDRGMYRVSYTMGTNEAGTIERDESGHMACKPNGTDAANFDYCSVNDFDMIVRVGGAQAQ